MPSPTDPSYPPPHDSALDVRGTLPPGLSGRLVGIGRDGVVHSACVREGRVSYSSRHFRSDAVVHNLIAFGGSVLASGDDSLAYELRTDAGTLRRVDLAGHGRYVADGSVGVAPRDGESRTTWIATGIAAPHPVHAYEAGDTVVVLALTPLLERWTLHSDAANLEREVLDPTPRRFAYCGSESVDRAPRCLWTTGNSTIGHHDLVSARHVHHNLRPDLTGDLVYVADATRDSDADGGWLVEFVHNLSGATTELRVIDATDIVRSAVATVPIPRPVPSGLRCTWIPSTQQ